MLRRAVGDVRLTAGDIILFRMNLFPVPNGQIHGLNGWLTEYIPPNTEVVGVRFIDPDGNTILPRQPGIASDDCGRTCNGFNSVPSSGGTRNLDDGSIAQLYADTGIFYSTDARTERSLRARQHSPHGPAPRACASLHPAAALWCARSARAPRAP